MEAFGAAKLVNLPPALLKPLPNALPEKPDPKLANPLEPVLTKGEVLEELAKLVVGRFSVAGVADDLKTEVVLEPRVPKGDASEPAKAANPDEAKAEGDVAVVEADAPLVADSDGGLDVPSEANGETAETFANALGKEG